MAISISQSIDMRGEFSVASHGLDFRGNTLNKELNEQMNDLISLVLLTMMDEHNVLPQSLGRWMSEWLTVQVNTKVIVVSIEKYTDYNNFKDTMQVRYKIEEPEKADPSGMRLLFDTVFPKDVTI